MSELCTADVLVESFEDGVHVADLLGHDNNNKFSSPRTRKMIADIGVDMLMKMVK